LQNVISNMAIKAEEIRQAKKFLENKKISISLVKPKQFVLASKKLNASFDDALNKLKEMVNGKTTTSNQEPNKKA